MKAVGEGTIHTFFQQLYFKTIRINVSIDFFFIDKTKEKRRTQDLCSGLLPLKFHLALIAAFDVTWINLKREMLFDVPLVYDSVSIGYFPIRYMESNTDLLCFN